MIAGDPAVASLGDIASGSDAILNAVKSRRSLEVLPIEIGVAEDTEAAAGGAFVRARHIEAAAVAPFAADVVVGNSNYSSGPGIDDDTVWPECRADGCKSDAVDVEEESRQHIGRIHRIVS